MSRIKTKFIEANAVSNPKLAQMPTQTIKGRTTAGTGDPEDLTATQATAILNNVVGDTGSGGTKGLVPAPATNDGVFGRFLRADGTWSATPIVNYILNSAAEVSAFGFATYKDAAAATPVDGTGGSPSLTFSRSTSSPLRGAASFLISHTAANLQGEGVSYDFTIDSADKAHQLAINFDYEVAGGTYVSGDLAVYVYDVTNAVMIQPSAYLINSVIGTAKAQTMIWQSASNSTSYRLIFHCASTNSSSFTLKVDNVSVSPQIVPSGTRAKPDTITRLLSGTGNYTPPVNCCGIIVDLVGSGSAGSGSGAGAGNGAAGNNTTFGSSFLTAGGGGLAVLGGNGGTGGVNTFNPGSTGAQVLLNVTGNGGRGSNGSGQVPAGSTSNYGGFGPWGGQGNANYFANANAPDANSGCGGNGAGTGVGLIQDGSGGGAGGRLQVFIPRPTGTFAYSVGASVTGGIAGTSGYAGAASGSGVIIITEMYYGEDVIISDSAATRAIVFKGTDGTGTLNATPNTLSYTVARDTHGMYSGGNITIRVPGDYRVDCGSALSGSASANQGMTLSVFKNGSPTKLVTFNNQASGSVYTSCTVSGILENLVAGDIITIRPSTDFSGPTYLTGYNTVSVSMIQGPVQIQAATIIAVDADSPTSLHTSSATYMTGFTERLDTVGAFNPTTGLFTAPAPGIYKYYAMYSPANTAYNGSVYPVKNGSILYGIRRGSGYSNGGVYASPATSGLVQLNTGDTLGFYAQNGTGSIATDAASCISIYRISGVN